MDKLLTQLEELNEGVSKLVEQNFAKSLNDNEQNGYIQDILSNLERTSELQEQIYYQIANVDERLSNIEDKINSSRKKEEM